MQRLVYLRRPSAAAALQERLVGVGFLRAACEDDVHGSRLVTWVRTSAEERVVRSLLGEPDQRASERVDEDALNTWKVKVTVGTWILGPGVAAPRGAKTVVTMPVGAGFGLGDHPTTLLTARLLAEHGCAGARVLDLGCGSGVLAALAGKLGAAQIDAVDLDSDAVAHTRKTLKANKVEGKAWTSNLLKRVPGTYDLVCANLVGDLLVEFFGGGTLHRVLTPEGTAFLSGISDAKRPAVLKALAADGWQVTRRLKDDLWTGLAIQRRP
jgi:ribosomal protein L11 methylase PrmA